MKTAIAFSKCSYSAKKNDERKTFSMILSYHFDFVNEKHFQKQAHVIHKLGGFYDRTSIALGSLPTNWQSCGKPSTILPHRGLVECLSSFTTSFHSMRFFCFKKLMFFKKNISKENLLPNIGISLNLRFGSHF